MGFQARIAPGLQRVSITDCRCRFLLGLPHRRSRVVVTTLHQRGFHANIKRGTSRHARGFSLQRAGFATTPQDPRTVSPQMTMPGSDAADSQIGWATKPQEAHWASIALGSNIGDRVRHIETAIQEMRKRGLEVRRISSLYETKPMYYENQDTFLNGACQIKTTLKPLELLDVLQEIEIQLGRERSIEKGPRTIDLDIILYDDTKVMHDRLQIPHKLLHEREFVLRPLVDIHSGGRLLPGFSEKTTPGRSVSDALNNLPNKDDSMSAISVLSPNLPLIRVNDPTRRTLIMAILNLTPDSFSDGGTHADKDIEEITNTVRDFIAAGASIMDIGGQSTRPGAQLLTAEEEMERIMPIIHAIRKMPEADQIAISVDTFYSKVAKESILAGADIVNDIFAGAMDEKMLETVALLGKTIILMHMRGDPHTMTSLTEYSHGIIKGVGSEIAERVKAAKAAGIPPWRIIVDPGIGFAKNQEQNVELLAGLNQLRYPVNNTVPYYNLPWLVGPSRKGFIGKITGVQQASQRTWGTAAAVTSSIAGGADIVRVHDVAEMAQVVKMADAIYRRPQVKEPY